MPVEKWKIMKEIIEVSNLKPHTKLGDAWTESMGTDVLLLFFTFFINKTKLKTVFLI